MAGGVRAYVVNPPEIREPLGVIAYKFWHQETCDRPIQSVQYSLCIGRSIFAVINRYEDNWVFCFNSIEQCRRVFVHLCPRALDDWQLNAQGES